MAPVQLVRIRLNRHSQPAYIKQRRVKKAGKCADFAGNLLGKQKRFREHLCEAGRKLSAPMLDPAQRDQQAGEVLSGAVVQFASNAPPFVVMRLKQPPGELAHLQFVLMVLDGDGRQMDSGLHWLWHISDRGLRVGMKNDYRP